ncbi:unnamed protein product [Hyaloperonospora brassicae]|uniref:HTH CENPB-type domain-containing protein n=1 Tax=Hyaloperonospora brassicae TaxID=162125 RepID=A0AAV0T4L3_HYABA|nr:unnamed protein product [Hyaloperonospora brassicae]
MVANGYTLTDVLRKEICMEKKRRPCITQEAVCMWMLDEHGVTITQRIISNVLKRSADLLGQAMSNSALHSKRQRAITYPLVETALARWVIEYRVVVNISGHLIYEKTVSFMKTLYPTVKDEDELAFSIVWLQKFRNHHGIRMHRRFGEVKSVDVKALEERLPKMRAQLDQYNAADIYNMDETGLFYRMQVDSSLSTHQLEGPKQSKERITMAICSNTDGFDEFPLWVIGKFLNPLCFINVDRRNLSVTYHANKTSR